MLKLTDHGAHITLQGQPTPSGDGLFWFGSALLIGAVGVAMAMSLLPERWAIGALALLIVGSFIFNRQRQKLKKQAANLIRGGVLDVRAGAFTHKALGTQNRVVIAVDDQIEIEGTELLILDVNNEQKCLVTGFETAKEAQVMQAILRGQQLNKRNANIKMQSN